MNPEDIKSWLAILGVSLTGIATRSSLSTFGTRLQLHPRIEQALRYAPAAVLSALVAPALLLVRGQVDLSVGNHRLVAAAIAALVMRVSRSMIAAIAVGMAVLTGLRLYG